MYQVSIAGPAFWSRQHDAFACPQLRQSRTEASRQLLPVNFFERMPQPLRRLPMQCIARGRECIDQSAISPISRGLARRADVCRALARRCDTVDRSSSGSGRLPNGYVTAFSKCPLSAILRTPRLSLWLSRKHDVVPIPKYKSLRCAPNDPLQLYHGPHAQPELPQQQMLNEIQREAPCPERQLPVADRSKAKPTQFEDEQIGAKEVVTPILKKDADAAIVMLSTAVIERSRRTNEQSSSRLERSPTPCQPRVEVLRVADRLERVDRVEGLVREFQVVEVGNNDLDATIELLELPPANVRLYGGIGYTEDFDITPTREVVGGSSGSASQIQQAHPLPQRLEQDIVRLMRMREERARKHTRAVMVVF